MEPQHQQRRRGRPRVVVTEAVLEQRRLAKQRSNAARRKRTCPAISEGSPGPSGTAAQPGPARTWSETPRKRNNINKRKRLFANNNTILDLGRLDRTCCFCQALVWDAESTSRHVGAGPRGYSVCCGKEKVQLPFLLETPPELFQLLTSRGREGDLTEQ